MPENILQLKGGVNTEILFIYTLDFGRMWTVITEKSKRSLKF